MYGVLTDFPVEQDRRPLAVLKTSKVVIQVTCGVGAITFSLFLSLSLFPPNHHQSHQIL